MKTLLSFCLLASLVLGAADIPRASSWGFDAADATECLQKAIDSGPAKLEIDNTGKSWILRPIRLRSNQELIFADGVRIEAKSGEFRAQGNSLFLAQDVRNVILRGNGNVTLSMKKKDYQDAARYKWSEWRHLISLRGCDDVKIENLTLRSSGGDGIYVSTGSNGQPCRNVTISKVNCDDHHRQGISVISAENLLIQNSRFTNTSGTPPACGIDFEPNKPNEVLINNRVVNCEFSGNSSAGVLLHLNVLNAASKPVSVFFTNCRITGNAAGVRISASYAAPVSGVVEFDRCAVTGNRGMALAICNQQNALKLLFRDSVFEQTQPGCAITISGDIPQDSGNIIFENSTVYCKPGAVMAYLGMTGCGIKSLDGQLQTVAPDGKKAMFNLKKFAAAHRHDDKLKQFAVRPINLKKLKPTSEQAVNQGSNIRYRGRFRFLQAVPGAGAHELKFIARSVGKSPLRIDVDVKDSNGTAVDRFRITAPEYSYVLKATGKQVYQFTVNTNGHTLSLVPSLPGQAIAADDRIGMFGGKQSFFFEVPAAATEVAVEMSADLGEPLNAALVAPDGRVVAEEKQVQGAKILRSKRSATIAPEIWRLDIPYAREDFKLRIGAPCAPLVATAPENLLIAE